MSQLLKKLILLLFLPSLSLPRELHNYRSRDYSLDSPPPNSLDPEKQNSPNAKVVSDQLRAYDCGNPTQISTVSLLSVGECNITRENTTTTKTKIHLLQRLDYQTVDIVQCKLNVFRHAFYCGWKYMTYDVKNGDAWYMADIIKEDCLKLHKEKKIEFRKDVFIEGKPNTTLVNPVQFAGTFSEGDYCNGDKFSDPYGSWESNIVAEGTVTVTLKNMKVNVQLSTQKIILPSGQHCDYKKGECMDAFNGHTFWNTVTQTDSQCRDLGILLQSKADKIKGEKKTIYKVETPNITFALAIVKTHNMCGTTIYETEHPRLLIYEDEEGVDVGRKMDQVENMDMMAYVNTKFLYYDFNMKREMTSLYYDILQKECELEKKVLQNTLMLAYSSPDEFALRFKKSQGYIGIVSGEVIHIAQCVPVEVRIRNTAKCYMELPVQYKDHPLYLNPITHILKSYGTEVPCSDGLATMFLLNNKWYKFNPKPSGMYGGGPQVLQPETKQDWSYSRPQYLADSGIYSSEDLEKMRNRIMNGQEQPAIVNEIIKGATGEGYTDPRISFWRLLEDEYNALNPWSWAWNKFVNFFSKIGTVCASLYGLFICCQIIKSLIHLIINAFSLDTIGGAVGHILTSIGKSVGYLFTSLFMGPTLFAKQEEKMQEMRIMKATKKIRSKRKELKNEEDDDSDVNDDNDDDDNESLTVSMHNKSNKNHKLKSNENENVEIHKMKPIIKIDS